MDHLAVYADASASGKSAVTEEGRLSAALLDIVPDYRIKLLGGYTLADSFARESQRFTGDPSGALHFFNLIAIFNNDHDTDEVSLRGPSPRER